MKKLKFILLGLLIAIASSTLTYYAIKLLSNPKVESMDYLESLIPAFVSVIFVAFDKKLSTKKVILISILFPVSYILVTAFLPFFD